MTSELGILNLYSSIYIAMLPPINFQSVLSEKVISARNFVDRLWIAAGLVYYFVSILVGEDCWFISCSGILKVVTVLRL